MMNVRFNKIKNIFLAALAVLMLFLSFPQVLYAKDPDSSKIYVTDEAEILSDTKESKLQKKCKSVSKNCKTDVAVLTISKGLDYTDLDNYVRTFAKEKGYSLTMYNRRREIPEIKSSNFMQRSFGERVAMNAPIQGTAADIIKLAMINVYNALRENNLKSRLILQVHDELLVETAEDEVDTVKQIMLDGMKNAVSLKVPLEVDLKEGKDWLEAH